ncbi:MAG TPA: S1/P1 nuclease [Rhizomicrobium sp.]|jgi:hypothetical protein
MYRFLAIALVIAASLCQPAFGWTRPGHMVTAAIAYDDLIRTDPNVIARVVTLIASHPDKGSFEVAVGRTTGDARARRIFLQMARWPDDIRGGVFDHPTWHYAFRPVSDPRDPPPAAPPDRIDGDAIEAFALNVREAGNENAPAAARAVALCWVFHLVGDIHQPLHNAQLFSKRFPTGDHGGGLQFVKDPETGNPISLHWLWDDSVNRSDDPEVVLAKARELEARLPRASLTELKTDDGGFAHWARDESFPLAQTLAYRADEASGTTAETVVAQKAGYLGDMKSATDRRVALAGYRLADVLRAALGP